MKTLAEYTQWMRGQIQLKVDEIAGWDALEDGDIAYFEGQTEAYNDVLSLLDAIAYPEEPDQKPNVDLT